MGVHGLWKLLEAAGKPVPLETLENKVLAVDVSIWLHQMMKGFQDSRGAPVPNAHLLGLFHRVCKLLYYRIKPVFVFDGGVPLLKRQTIAARKNLKKQASNSAAEAREKLLKNLVKRKAVRQIIDGPKIPDETESDITSKDDMFALPPMSQEVNENNSEDESSLRLQVFVDSGTSEDDSEPEIKPNLHHFDGQKLDLHTLDVHSEEFLSLPPDVRHDILSELKETRKQNSWGRLHEMPEESGEFSSYQLGRLLKRRNVQVSLEKAEKEMGGKVMRINELQELMTAQGVNIIEQNAMIESTSQRIASDSATRYVLCKDSTSGAQSSMSLDSESVKVKNEQLYNEQTEFISKMAESMLQKIAKKNSDVCHKDKELMEQMQPPDEIIEKFQDDEIHENVSGAVFKPKPNKILVDSWSSDDDDMVLPEVTKHQTLVPEIETMDSSKTVKEKLTPIKNSLSGVGRDSGLIASSIKSQHIDVSNKVPVEDLNDSIRKETSKVQTQNISKTADKPFVEVISDKQDLTEKRLEPVPKLDSVLDSEDDEDLSIVQNKTDTSTSIKKAIEIVIRPREKPDDDDIFADIFESKSTDKSEILITKKTEETIEYESDTSISPVLHKNIESNPEIDEEVIQIGNQSDFSEESVEEVTSGVAKLTDEVISLGDASTSKETTSSVSFLLSSKAQASGWEDVVASLQEEQLELQKERGRQERLAASITDQMCVEAQELLQLFGVPYIVAPMEAEAQCAFFDAISMTEGSITDDSDIWLFGGKKVYKNFFNQKKHVLQFTLSNINHYFKVSREQLVQLALLVGSDYTTGIQGIGPVTALEIVAAFHGKSEADPVQCALKGLSQFKDWWNGGRPHKSNHMRHLDRKLKNIKFSEGFPSRAVVEAYLQPSVEDSTETFSWGALDLPALREFARSKFGWTVSKTDEILLPVAKRWSDRTSQRTIESYFNFQPQLVEGLNKMSKRVQKAVTLMDDDNEDVDDPDPITSSFTERKKQGKKRRKVSKQTPTKRKKYQSQGSTSSESGSDVEGQEKEINSTVVGNTTRTELPVRAPTVPRVRSSTGVKRVGLKSVVSCETAETSDHSKTAVVMSRNPQQRKKKSSEGVSKKTTQKRQDKSTKNVNQKAPGERPSTNVADKDDILRSTVTAINDLPSGSGASFSLDSNDVPKPIQSNNSNDGNESATVPLEVAALSEMNWEEDPWAGEQADNIPTQERRPKLYFGGVRPNRTKRPPRNIPPPRASSDARGVQPGWLTQERLQSRSAAWIDASHKKKEESIPQRERDQRALEEAKMKAISLVKASESRQAARLLGGNKRSQKRTNPVRKVLPEHNLSESSSDE